MLDEDLADLYGVETRVLVQQVRRNERRFPADFMFQLSTEEFDSLKSQFVMSSGGHGGRRKRPLVFTEQGVAMLSAVLRSGRAITVNIEIMRAFVELRRVASSFQELEKRLDQMELDIGARLSEHDEQLRQIFEALRQLIAPTPRTKRPDSRYRGTVTVFGVIVGGKVVWKTPYEITATTCVLKNAADGHRACRVRTLRG
jgi:ORF6N domain